MKQVVKIGRMICWNVLRKFMGTIRYLIYRLYMGKLLVMRIYLRVFFGIYVV